jgi:preprotein translocase subunit SecF
MIYQFYEKHWKIWPAIPFVLLILSVVLVVSTIFTTGAFMKRDIELMGGKEVSFQITDADVAAIKQALPGATVQETSGISRSLIVDVSFDADETEVIRVVEEHATVIGEPTLRTVGPAIGNIFFQQAQFAMILAFIFMAITVLIVFRSPVPSGIVVLSAITDIVVTIGILNFLGVTLSLAVIAALLTVIGYSVDTDMLLTSELLKGGHAEAKDAVKRAMKTGLTMTATTLVALLAMYFVSGSIVIEQIAFVLIIGLLVDVPATWFTNAGILRLWMERKKK